MANAVHTTLAGATMTIEYEGSGADWWWNVADDTTKYPAFPNGLKVRWIHFHPSGANDVLIVHEQGIDGPEIMRCKCTADTDDRIHYLDGEWIRPVIDLSDCTFGTIGNVRITMQLE